ncbi:hypothetical protein [Burkholderia pseudomallei]|uniref:hypothetical protein n=1 Tax=Burkholderia pseudomallei TaxID=28450 RepID=UPI000AE6BFB7|nr:hypothetical protein [Burkholderia pseudomallei]
MDNFVEKFGGQSANARQRAFQLNCPQSSHLQKTNEIKALWQVLHVMTGARRNSAGFG